MADTMQFVPACRLDQLVKALKRRITAGREVGISSYSSTLHWICAWLRVGVDFWDDGVYDGNSEKEWNPVYRHSGRREGPSKPLTSRTKNLTPGWRCGERFSGYADRVQQLSSSCQAKSKTNCGGLRLNTQQDT